MTHFRFDFFSGIALSLATAIVGCSAGPKAGSSNAAAGPAATVDSGSAAPDSASPAPRQAGYYSDGASDLAAVASDTGFYIETPDYNASDPNASNLIVQPGQEIFLCYSVTLPNTSEVDIGGFQSWMSPGSSHHFIVYQQGGTGPFAGTAQPSGTVSTCRFAGGTWIYATSTPGVVVGMNMPDGVGLPFAAATNIVLNMHFINPGTSTLYPKVKLNILLATNVQYKAASMVSFNVGINVPPATASGPGTQTVSGTCKGLPAGTKFFTMSTHTHKHATAAVIDFVSGGASQEIVHTGPSPTYPAVQQQGTGTDWEHPGVALWNAPDYLTVNDGDSFTYSCTYENQDPTTAVRVGETAASNEMCMAVGYYFPAATPTASQRSWCN
jgi:hypothetical protein